MHDAYHEGENNREYQSIALSPAAQSIRASNSKRPWMVKRIASLLRSLSVRTPAGGIPDHVHNGVAWRQGRRQKGELLRLPA